MELRLKYALAPYYSEIGDHPIPGLFPSESRGDNKTGAIIGLEVGVVVVGVADGALSLLAEGDEGDVGAPGEEDVKEVHLSLL